MSEFQPINTQAEFDTRVGQRIAQVRQKVLREEGLVPQADYDAVAAEVAEVRSALEQKEAEIADVRRSHFFKPPRITRVPGVPSPRRRPAPPLRWRLSSPLARRR
jgi:hypothetical protein